MLWIYSFSKKVLLLDPLAKFLAKVARMILTCCFVYVFMVKV